VFRFGNSGLSCHKDLAASDGKDAVRRFPNQERVTDENNLMEWLVGEIVGTHHNRTCCPLTNAAPFISEPLMRLARTRLWSSSE